MQAIRESYGHLHPLFAGNSGTLLLLHNPCHLERCRAEDPGLVAFVPTVDQLRMLATDQADISHVVSTTRHWWACEEVPAHQYTYASLVTWTRS